MPQPSQLNPWISMWTQPRETIRWIVETNPKYGILRLSTVYVLQSLFYFLNFWSFGLSFPLYSLLIPVLILAPILAFFWIFFYGWILRLIGRLLGGRAPAAYLRASLAWSRLPMGIALAMWFVLFVANPDYVFIQYVGGPSALFVNLILLILEVWTFVLFVQSVREVQHFSIIRSLCQIFLSSFIYGAILFGMMLVGRFFYLI